MCCVHLMNKWQWKAHSHASKYRPHRAHWTLQTRTILSIEHKQQNTHTCVCLFLPGDPVNKQLIYSMNYYEVNIMFVHLKVLLSFDEAPHLFRFFMVFNAHKFSPECMCLILCKRCEIIRAFQMWNGCLSCSICFRFQCKRSIWNRFLLVPNKKQFHMNFVTVGLLRPNKTGWWWPLNSELLHREQAALNSFFFLFLIYSNEELNEWTVNFFCFIHLFLNQPNWISLCWFLLCTIHKYVQNCTHN